MKKLLYVLPLVFLLQNCGSQSVSSDQSQTKQGPINAGNAQQYAHNGRSQTKTYTPAACTRKRICTQYNYRAGRCDIWGWTSCPAGGGRRSEMR